MIWRKCLVRGLVFSSLGGVVLIALVYQAWTNPAATRRQVLDKLSEKFTGAVVGVESAQLWPFGYIAVSELRMARRDDLDRNDFLYAPSVLIYHDKEQLLEGHLAIRRVELKRPRLRIVRRRDGTLNLNGILGPLDLNERVPLIVLQQATLVVEDRSGPAPAPILEISDVNLTVVNDPLPILHVEASGHTDVAGPMQLAARLHRGDGESALTFKAPVVPVGPVLLQRLGMLAPGMVGPVRNLTGVGKVEATLVKRNLPAAPLSYDLNVELHGGALTHPRLPLPLEHMEATAHIQDGRVAQAQVKARSGPARFDVAIRDAALPSGEPACIENLVNELDARVEHLPVDATLLAALPADMQQLEPDFKPAGPLSFTHTFRREGTDRWRKHWTFQPEEMSAEFFKFRYPIQKITGTIIREATSDQRHTITMNLSGSALGRSVRLMGRLDGEKPREHMEIDVWGDDIPIDEVLLNALPAKDRALAARFSLSGRTDIKAQIRRAAGQREFANRFFLRFHDATARFDQFPYPVERISGVLDILPDHWECRDFRGSHKGGEVLVWGQSMPLPSSEAGGHEAGKQRVQVTIQGTDILLDDEFEEALAPPAAPSRTQLQKAWRTMALTGRLSFTAEVIDVPNQPQNLDVAVTLRGCAMEPRFFPYALHDVSGSVHYLRDQVRLSQVKARHGTSVLGLREGLILLKPGGGFQARLAGVTGEPVVPDAEFLKALPLPLRKGIEPLQLHDPVAVDTQLIVDVAPEAATPPLVWWDGKVTLHNAILRTGIDLAGVEGEVACCGRHNGRTLEGIKGNFDLAKVSVRNQPLNNVHGALEVWSDSPDILRVRNLGADWFGGTLGGEGRVEFKDTLRYDVVLKAVQVRLEEFARHNMAGNAEVQGAATAALHLHGEGTGIENLKGFGRVDVPNGKLYRLPLLLDLIKAFGLRIPDRTAFEQASMAFKIDGPQLEIQHLNLFGNAFSLRGQGTLKLDGSDLNLDFHTDWARVMQVLPPALNELPRALSDQLFKIKMRGQIGDVRLEKEVLPVVIDPLRRALGRE